MDQVIGFIIKTTEQLIALFSFISNCLVAAIMDKNYSFSVLLQLLFIFKQKRKIIFYF